MTEEKNTTKEQKPSRNASDTTKNEKVFLSQRGVLYNAESEKYLITKEVRFNEANGAWQAPGGRIDPEEDVNEAFIREIQEETGLEPENYDNAGYLDLSTKTLYGSQETWGIITFQLLLYKTGAIVLSDEHEEHRWVTAKEVASNKEEYTDWLRSIITAAEKKREQLNAHDKMLRTLAEFDNYKKRSGEQQKDFVKYASEKVIMEMLPILDNFHAATSFVPEDQKDSPWLTGIMYIQQQMEKVFEDAGVSVIEINPGDVFDPETMEALDSKKGDESERSDSTEGEQKVEKIIQKGYTIGGRLMRPARVEIS